MKKESGDDRGKKREGEKERNGCRGSRGVDRRVRDKPRKVTDQWKLVRVSVHKKNRID